MADKPPDPEQFEMFDQAEPFQSGFNWRTVWGTLFVGFIMLPGAIYLGLVTGSSIQGGAEWVTIILFLEVARRAFIKLKRQEIIILYWAAAGLVVMGGKLGTGADLFGGPFGGLIWNQYLIQSPQAEGLRQYIPSWYAPSVESAAYLQRSFIHADWLGPIAVLLVSMALFRINDLSLGYVLYRITNDIERLPFPMAPVHAGGATALAETSARQEGWRWRVFSWGAVIGIGWSALYSSVPIITGLLLTKTVTIFPIPFFDFTEDVKDLLPATPLAISSNFPGPMLMGFVLPFYLVVGEFVVAALMTLFGYRLLYQYGVLRTWWPGMRFIPTNVSNSVDFFISFFIGTALVIAAVGVAATVRAVLRQRGQTRSARAALPEGRGDMAIWKALLIWALGTMGFLALCYRLVPGFPWWVVAIFGFLWTPLNSYINARMVGLTGGSGAVSFPYVREASFYLFYGQRGAEVWFAPIPLNDHGWMVHSFKQLELTRTRFGSLVKMTALSFVVMCVCSFLFWSLIWKLAPIPSSAYPFVQRMWPMNAYFQCLWAKSTLPGGSSFISQVIDWHYIVAGAGIGGTIYALLTVLGAPVMLFYGAIVGLGQSGFMALPTFAGAMLGRFYFQRKLGRERWTAYAPILCAGYFCGFGLIGTTSVALALIGKAVSQVVY